MIFQTLLSDPSSLAASILLLVTVISLWMPQKKWITVFIFLAYIVFSLLSHRMTFISWLILAATGIGYIAFYHSKQTLLKNLSFMGFVFLSFIILLNKTPGVTNWPILYNYALSPDSTPFTLYLSYDAPLIGVLILFFGHTLIASWKDWLLTLKKIVPIIVTLILLMIPAALALGYVRFDPKFSALFIVWGLSNLLLTCVTEEAIFRGIFQKYLMQLMTEFKYGSYAALVIAAILFGLAHLAGGVAYALLAGVAGLFYGYAYYRTGRIEASILTHFALNSFHFLFFSYPALAVHL